NDLQTFGITCDVFCMTSEVGFLDIGTNKRRRIGVDEKVQVPQKLYEAGVPTVLVGKVADIVSNPYG
ncbi:hypothetical protein, partial [Escherichia coli]|uniref:hypothetical protein n=1 Tax=Escherichia coli TaxID=562 RepID=UPI003EE414F0